MKINNKNYKYKIAVIPGDGIGKEVINACLTLLKAILDLTNIKISKTIFPWGSNYFRKHGIMMLKSVIHSFSSPTKSFSYAIAAPFKLKFFYSLISLILSLIRSLKFHHNSKSCQKTNN